MSKRTGSSIPLTVEKVKSKRRMDSPISKSDSSSDPHDETEHNLLAPAPLSYAPLIPPLITYALESIGVALSRQASLRRDIASVIPFPRTSRRDVLRFSEHKIVAMFSGQALGLGAGGMCSIGALPLWSLAFGRSTQL
ncbi:hypothetical protein F2Q68_00009615 [Brassica cretica]|uniref:Uncharacterized protein n=1 Tax=Brassica cretica TaxID=69181 RepID=A0A8S9KXK7_BRACR|nr:hypothetical protein F2Q68_00009615 [Brassica cretica]